MKKRNSLAGTFRIFRFTLWQCCSQKAWLATTVILGALLLIGIPLLLLLSVKLEGDSTEDVKQPFRTVYVCDETEGSADYSALTQDAATEEPITYTLMKSFNEAKAALEQADPDTSALLHITREESAYALTLCLADDTAITQEDAYALADAIEAAFPMILVQKTQLTPQQLGVYATPVVSITGQLNADGTAAEEKDIATQIIEFAFPFFIIMLMYFMVLFYGQSVANSVLLEKTSKLMDTMLTAVHPFALIFGKLFAVTFSAFLQILIWLISGVFGCIIGMLAALDAVPDTDNSIVTTLNTLSENQSIFTVKGIVLAVIFIGLGILLYCALSSISGALASKAEDLGKTNYIFVLVLLFSFFMCLGSPNTSNSMISTAPWLNYFPFTAILVVPGQLLLGQITALQTVISMAIMLFSIVAIIWIAATIYRLMVLYRGKVPNIKTLLAMLKKSPAGDAPHNDPAP